MKTYKELIKQFIKRKNISEPIYLRDIVDYVVNEINVEPKSAAYACATAIGRLKEEIPNLRTYKKGIYYLTKETPFGELKIDKNKLIYDKYIKGDNGYEINIFNKLGLSTWIPGRTTIVSNKWSGPARYIKEIDVYVKGTKALITAENKKYLQLLDALKELDRSPIDAENKYQLISKYIDKENISYKKLLELCDKYYSNKEIIKIAKIAGV